MIIKLEFRNSRLRLRNFEIVTKQVLRKADEGIISIKGKRQWFEKYFVKISEIIKFCRDISTESELEERKGERERERLHMYASIN